MMENVLLGIIKVFVPFNFVMLALGTLVGVLVGAIPGIEARC